jgi:hypothetical protein
MYQVSKRCQEQFNSATSHSVIETPNAIMASSTVECGDIIREFNEIPGFRIFILCIPVLSSRSSFPAPLLRSPFPFRFLPFVHRSKRISRYHPPSRSWFLIQWAEAWSPRIKQTHRKWLLVERAGLEGTITDSE